MLIGGSPCFTKGHYVLTDKGYKDISEVETGDLVLTHKGNYKPVIRTYKRMAETKEVNIVGFTNFITTGNHPFYSIKREKSSFCEYKQTGSWRKFSNPEWTKVDDMTTDTFCGKHTYIPEEDFEIDNELLWILGRYIADGHLRITKRKGRKDSYQYQVIISVSKDKLGDFKKNVVSRYFSCYPHSQNVYRCVFSSMELCNLIDKSGFGRNAHEKQIPERFMRLPPEKTKILLDGYLSGDGHFDSDSGAYACSTISPVLALQIQRLVAHIYNTNAGVYINANSREHYINGRKITNNYPLYTVTFKNDERKQSVFYVQDNIIWTPVKSVTPTNKTETVYNIEVADDNSYTVNNCIVHNCTYWSIAKVGRETTPDGIGGQLFMQYVRALKESECRYFLYENNHSIHKDIKAYISEQLGVEPIMINSALVSGQNRKRCYWTNIPHITQPKDKGILLKDILDNKSIAINEINGKLQTIMVAEPLRVKEATVKGYAEIQAGECVDLSMLSSKTRRGRSMKNKSNCLCTGMNFYQYLGKDKLVKDSEVRAESYPIRIGTIPHGGNKSYDSKQWRVYSIQGKSVTLCGQGGGAGAKTGLYKIDLPDGEYIIRKLTPLEAERLQTLPDNYTAGISNTQRYKCVGNGWTVDVITHIFSFLPPEARR